MMLSFWLLSDEVDVPQLGVLVQFRPDDRYIDHGEGNAVWQRPTAVAASMRELREVVPPMQVKALRIHALVVFALLG